jgi:hypothetical protein
MGNWFLAGWGPIWTTPSINPAVCLIYQSTSVLFGVTWQAALAHHRCPGSHMVWETLPRWHAPQHKSTEKCASSCSWCLLTCPGSWYPWWELCCCHGNGQAPEHPNCEFLWMICLWCLGWHSDHIHHQHAHCSQPLSQFQHEHYQKLCCGRKYYEWSLLVLSSLYLHTSPWVPDVYILHCNICNSTRHLTANWNSSAAQRNSQRHYYASKSAQKKLLV